MNHELLSRALKACPVPDGDKWVLRCYDDGFDWRTHDNTKARDCSDFDAHNAMTARWLGWLIEQGYDPMFLHNKGMVVVQILNCHKGNLNDCVGDTPVESLAAAIIAVSEAK